MKHFPKPTIIPAQSSVQGLKLTKFKRMTTEQLIQQGKILVAKQLMLLQRQISPKDPSLNQPLRPEDVFMLEKLMKLSFELEKREEKNRETDPEVSQEDLISRAAEIIKNKVDKDE